MTRRATRSNTADIASHVGVIDMQLQSAQPAAIGLPPAAPANTPLWLRLGEVAAELGLHPELLLTAIEARQLPLRVTQFGNKGLWHVNAADMRAYRVWLAAGGAR